VLVLFTLFTLIALLVSLALVAPGVATAKPASPGSGPGDSGSVSTTARLSADVRALVKGSGPEAEAKALAAYWTPQRMNAAKSLDGVPSSNGLLRAEAAPVRAGAPAKVAEPTGPAPDSPAAAEPQSFDPNLPATHTIARTYGKVFLTLIDKQGGRHPAQCSATVVNSPRRDMVWTAGHCVHGGHRDDLGDTWHENWFFVPAFKNGPGPYGTWMAVNLATRANWANNGDLSEDVGVAVVAPIVGRKIVDIVGGQGLAVNFPAKYHAFSFGYPVAPPFDGQKLIGCEGDTAAFGTTLIALVCDMTPGSSGGGWLRQVNRQGYGYLNGLNSHSRSAYPGFMFSPYYGEAVRSLFNFVVNEV
jgi:V8-like Glu-specific endopeptidase